MADKVRKFNVFVTYAKSGKTRKFVTNESNVEKTIAKFKRKGKDVVSDAWPESID